MRTFMRLFIVFKVTLGEKDQEIAMLSTHLKGLEAKEAAHAQLIAQMEKDIEVFDTMFTNAASTYKLIYLKAFIRISIFH